MAKGKEDVHESSGEKPSQGDNGQTHTRSDLAEDRTQWAHRRTLLAKERTFAAWVRTGLAVIAVGFGVTRLLREFEPRWLVMAIGAFLILNGIIILGLGYWSYREAFRELEQEGVRGLPMWLIGGLALMLMLAGVAGLILLLPNP
jgi:putative membrane protein